MYTVWAEQHYLDSGSSLEAAWDAADFLTQAEPEELVLWVMDEDTGEVERFDLSQEVRP